MRVIIAGKGMEVSDYLKEMVTKKVTKLQRYFGDETEAHITMSIQKSRHIVEVTIPFDGVVLRGEEATGDMYASIDGVLRKLEKQIHKHRTALKKRLHEGAFLKDNYEYINELEEEKIPTIVRTKRFVVKPMDLEEAQMQMELLGHQFFVFKNAKTNDVNVLYKRLDGDLGLIEPDYD
ncbi:MAG: ribosome-associated translation inhibitor RaiA [Eubacteriales bacterium]|nr:ribosome-associated translation inhibitor RaiA [Eubacteriales bacterium]